MNLIDQAVQLHQAGKLGQAGQLYRQILLSDPNNVDALHMLGVVAFQQSSYPQSIQLIERAMLLSPQQASIHHNLGSTYRVVARFEDARKQYRTAIEIDERYYEAYFNLAAITKFSPEDDFGTRVESLLTNSDVSLADQIFLHFAAGKFFDDTGQYDRAFAHYLEGNQLKAGNFDAQEYNNTVDQIIQVVNKDLLQSRQGVGNPDTAPVFIVGLPRSGTTLLEQIISSHPQADGAGELPDIPSISNAIQQHHPQHTPYPHNLTTLPDGVFAGFGRSYLSRIRGMHPAAARVIDKNPINHHHVGFIKMLLPNARVLHCHRNPLDTALSCFFQNFRTGQDFSYSYDGIATFYKGYRRLMDHWHACLPEQVLDVCYEEIVEDTEGQTRRILEFLGLPFDEQCLNFHKSSRPVATASDIQVRQPIYKKSVARWTRYQNHLGELRTLMGITD